MSDRPNEQPLDVPCDGTALEARLRQYYDAQRAAGPTTGELCARVAAQLASERADMSSRSTMSIPQEIAVMSPRSDSTTPNTAPGALKTPRRDGRVAGIAAVLVTTAVIVLAALIFTSMRQPLAPSQISAPAHTSIPSHASGWTGWKSPLSTGAWDAIYLDTSGHLHAVSPAGQDYTGPALPLPGLIDATPRTTASISPDGRRLAYIQGERWQASYSNTGGKVAIIDFATGTLKVAAVTAMQIAWSTDSSTIAAAGQLDSGTIWIVNAATGAGHPITLQVDGTAGGLGRLLSWTDGTHLAAIVSAGAPQADKLSGGPQNLLGIIDVTSGQTRIITKLVTPPDVYVSPDGAVALVASSAWNPTAQLVNLRTGSVTSVPNITAAFADKLVNMDNADYAQGGNYSVHFAWRPGTHTLALSMRASGVGPEGSVGPATQPTGVWLLNLDVDTATQITHNTLPLAWSADGQALLLCSPPPTSALPTAGAGVGPNLSALSPVVTGGKQHQLASGMAVFLGIAV